MAPESFRRPHNLLTIYGRKPVLEALQDPAVDFFRVHLADSNKPAQLLRDIESLCRQRGIEVRYHDRMALSRISKNRKQDQGVAADVTPRSFGELQDYLAAPLPNLLALDRITNPQNLGMIIRSVTAGWVDGLLIPRRGCARIDSLVIKASAGTLFQAPLYFCEDLPEALQGAKEAGVSIYGLTLENSHPLQQLALREPRIMVLGNESEGLSKEVLALCHHKLHIPMQNQVESLNVAVTAGILAFAPLWAGGG